MNTTILLAGCGKMGTALLSGWLARGVDPANVVVVDPAGVNHPAILHSGVQVVGSSQDIPASFIPQIVLLAVKPQMMDSVVPAYARFPQAVFLSIAAGKTLSSFASLLGDVAIVRSMPNTPAAVGRGITVCVPNDRVSADQRILCQSLLEAVGTVEWLQDESLMDAVTAVSGSGPAYVFWLAEIMALAGAKAGLPPELADSLARATVAGAGELLHQAQDSSAQLRVNVTSPGGTTAAALAVLMDPQTGCGPLMDQAVTAAIRRGQELAAQ